MEKQTSAIYKMLLALVKLFYPRTEVEGLAHLPEEPCVIVANHAQMNGPIAGEIYFPGEHYIWCAGEMMHLRDVPAYAYRDFWSRKPGYIRWFYKLLSYIIAPLSVCIFNNAHTIPVYRDKRVLSTFRETLKHLQEGENVIIFPEHDAPHDHILCDFQEGFVSLARMYQRQTGKELAFVPMYLAPALKKMYLGPPVRFRADAPFEEEQRRICDELMTEISRIACGLPRHKVVPYNNIPKKGYGYNIPR